MDTKKYIVIAVVSENKLSEITQTERDFKDMIEGIIRLDFSLFRSRLYIYYAKNSENNIE